MQAEDQLQAFIDSREKVSIDALFTFYDSLPALPAEFMLGEWEGGVFNTGHPGEQQLQALNWVGKRFHSANDVNPIISTDADGQRIVNPVLGTASLREVSYRGTVTATMVYDKHPVFDHFRKISDELVLGVMDKKGDDFPLFFYLYKQES